MPNRLGPVLIHLRHPTPELLDEFDRAELIVCRQDSVSPIGKASPSSTLDQTATPIDSDRPPIVIVSDGELPDRLLQLFGPSIRERQTTVLHVGHWKQHASTDLPAPDAVLPMSVSERELVQSTKLLAEIAVLRMANRVESTERDRWHQLALVDQLTGLPNRRGWEAELERRAETQQGFCMGIVDLDFFKRINDRSGHNVGDAVLKETAQIMRTELRRGDFLARLGGDEFGVIVGPMPIDVSRRVFDRLRESVSSRLQLAELPSTTLSAGCVVIPSGGTMRGDEAYAVASKSLQAAKQAQRNQTIAQITPS